MYWLDSIYAERLSVSKSLYHKICKEMYAAIDNIVNGRFESKPIGDRIQRLKKNCTITRSLELELDMIFNVCDFWYVEAAAKDLDDDSFLKILVAIQNHPEIVRVKHINFKPLLNNIYYDYEYAKKVNIYKKRIIENLMDKYSFDNIRKGTEIKRFTW